MFDLVYIYLSPEYTIVCMTVPGFFKLAPKTRTIKNPVARKNIPGDNHLGPRLRQSTNQLQLFPCLLLPYKNLWLLAVWTEV